MPYWKLWMKNCWASGCYIHPQRTFPSSFLFPSRKSRDDRLRCSNQDLRDSETGFPALSGLGCTWLFFPLAHNPLLSPLWVRVTCQGPSSWCVLGFLPITLIVPPILPFWKLLIACFPGFLLSRTMFRSQKILWEEIEGICMTSLQHQGPLRGCEL